MIKQSSCIIVALACALFASAAGCSNDSPSLEVLVVTSLVPGPQFSLVETELLAPSALYEPATRLARAQTDASFGDAFTRGHRVAIFADVARGEHVVQVRLRRPDGTLLISRRARVTVQDNFVLRLALTPDCVGVMCPSPTGSPTLNACFGGQCVDERCIPPNPEFCPALSFCNEASDCSAPNASCAEAACVDGVCVEEARANACASNEWCDPQSGCVPREEDPDAATPDAGIEDAHVLDDAMIGDAQTPTPDSSVCGTFCNLLDDPCHVGAIRCDGEAATCEPFATRAVGTSCGSGLICNSLAQCVSCTAGVACSVGCFAGVTRCSSGSETCDIGGGTNPLDPGAACSNVATCYEGETCGDGDTCSATQLCERCTGDGTACTTNSGCQSGVRSCALGNVCTIDELAEYGAACRTVPAPGDVSREGFCDGAGVCTQCNQGERCELPTGCGFGRMMCPGNPYGFVRGYCYPYEDSGVPVELFREDTVCDGGVCNGQSMCVVPVVANRLGRHGPCFVREGGTIGCWSYYGVPFHGATYWGMAITDIAGLPASTHVSGDTGRGCSISTSGELWCWTSPDAPAVVPLPEQAIDVSIGYITSGSIQREVSCVTLMSGQLMCWGSLYLTGVGNQATPTAVPGLADVVFMDAGSPTAIALRATGEIRVWGSRHQFGVLGNGVDYPPGTGTGNFALSPVATLPVSNARIVRSSDHRACALQDGGTLQCWGRAFGAGVFPYGGAASNTPQPVALPFTDVEDFSIVTEGLCLLRSTGEVWCYGSWFASGREGIGTYAAPGPVSYLSDVVQLEGSCALTSAGRIYCFSGLPMLIGESSPLAP